VLEQINEPQEVFTFIQRHAKLSDFEMYQTFNMGMDYALFVREQDALKAQAIGRTLGLESIAAGYVERGAKQVIIEPKNIRYTAESMQLR
jgi:phosphoribosylformylglycinamidine cyclo-ligase